ncbi:SUMF1/EgtB/PvdO family nonheme iron enzyme [Caballeronia sp. J97]|uniref:SUMF1/EgtB/PvdO family nonheme iron enzyme n=1 Tax=Caballeronia sp. J97 TaxID=2805429 RepID=UPI0039F053C0
MGSDSKLAQANERPAHKVRVHGYWMDEHHMSHAECLKFVAATGYVTTAEKKPDWDTLRVQLPPNAKRCTRSIARASMRVAATAMPGHVASAR